jgi:ATP-binding cassette subfamily C protein CydCD
MKLNPRLLQEARLYPIILTFSICLGLAGGIMGILQARQVTTVISQVFLAHKTLPAVANLLLAILAIILMRSAFTWVGEACASVAARCIKQDLRHRLFTHIMDLGPAFLSEHIGEAQARTGELVNTATEGIDALEVYFSQYLPQLAFAALIPLVILLFAFPIDLLSGMIFLVTAPLLPLFMYLIGSAAETLTRRQWQGLGRMNAYFLDVLQGLTTLKALGRSHDQAEVIDKVSENYRQTTMRVLRVTFLSALALELIATLSTAVIAVEIGIRLLYGHLLFEQAFFLLLLAPEFYQPLRLLGTRFHAGMAGVEAAKSIFAILDLPAHRIDQSDEPPPITPQTPPSIRIQDVGFAYIDGQPILHGVTFEIPAGKMTALCGESGAGKTTLTRLLLRFLQPQAGQISVDGTLLETIPTNQWWDRLSWVSQNPYLFNDTVMANIQLAKPEADKDAIYAAARLAHADEFIRRLPFGYQTVIGERGMRLSAGQAQRIALARASLKDASFLILDEATSHLDPETDALMCSSLARLCPGRTVLVIAHRQSTLAMADQVVRLSRGHLAHIEPVRHKLTPGWPMQNGSMPGLSPQNTIETAARFSDHTHKELTHPSGSPFAFRLLKLLSPYAGRIFLSVFLGFATIASGIGLMATAAYIISAAALHPSIADLEVAIVGVRFFGLSRGIFRYLERLVTHDTTLRLLARWRTWFYQALEPLAPARLLGYHSADLLTRLISDIASLENFYVRCVAPPLVALLVGVATSLFIGSFGRIFIWGLALFLFLAGIGLPALALVFSRKIGPEILHQRTHLAVLLVDGIQGMADILALGQAAIYREKVRQAGERLSKLQLRMSVFTSLLNALHSLLANLSLLAVLALAVQRVSAAQLDGVLLGVVVLVAFTCFEALQPLPLAAQNFAANRAAALRLYELVDAAPEVADPPEPLELPQAASLDVRGVSFHFPALPDREPVTTLPSFSLKDISFSLSPGKHIALIGTSGAGKTTLVSLLLRFWEYQDGSILFDGNELRRYLQEDVRRRMAIIPQSTYLFNATIKDNLLIARPDATETEIIQAARQAQLHGFISSLPEGYDTWIGEHGLRLSAGERQRLAVARALLLDTPLLILDEPTANLDPVTELAVLNAIQNACLGRSSITITQSMSGLPCMDEILVLQDGCIVERGSHDRLIACRGLYRQMWDLYHQII